MIEDNPGDSRLLREQLAGLPGSYNVVEASTLTEALELLAQRRFDVVLCDLNLPDATGLETVAQLRRAATTPVVVLTGMGDEALAAEALKLGAQDYLQKGGYNLDLLGRSIRYAIERQRLINEVLALSLHDELTGLYNRRGLACLAEQYIKLSRRTQRTFMLFYFDINNMKEINDRYGHKAGDEAIQTAASLLRQCFRAQDIVARIGGDEFVALSLESDLAGAQAIVQRLHTYQESNPCAAPTYRLSLSHGFTVYDPASASDLDTLLAEADQAMYQMKLRVHAGSSLKLGA